MRLTIGDVDYLNINFVEIRGIVTGENESLDNALRVFPNPSANEFMISLNGDFEYEISDVSGAIIESGVGNNSIVVGAALTQGVYILTVKNDYGKSVKQLIKR